MRIGGWQKVSLIDYPGKISTIVFVQGCNFRCPFCHNPELVLKEKYSPLIEKRIIFDFLKKRKGEVEAVEITGGEPTISQGLADFLRRVKKMGYLTKLDTNGSKPEVLENLLQENLLDYIAMDIKGPVEKYQKIIGRVKVDIEKIKESIQLVKNSNVDYEFRTTFVKPLLEVSDFEGIGKMIKGAKIFVIQAFVKSKLIDKKSAFFPASEEETKKAKRIMENYADRVLLRE